jgi:hypothetical protein
VERFCVDTSSLVAAWSERYPPAYFPDVWRKFAEIIEDGRLFAPDEVRTELQKRSKDTAEWLDQFQGFFVPTDEALLVSVSGILRSHPRLVMEKKQASAADPFVIGLAMSSKAMVVTEEGFGSPGRPKIQLVCQHYKVECATSWA